MHEHRRPYGVIKTTFLKKKYAKSMNNKKIWINSVRIERLRVEKETKK